jgi:phage terminase small subunit
MALTPKQERFCFFYLGEAKGNGAEAARLAGYKDADVSAFDCKRNPAIRARIDERLLAESLSSAEVLAELTAIARSEWRHFLQIRTNPVTSEVVDAKIVLGDKVKALELLGKHHKLFTDKIEGVTEMKVQIVYDDGGDTPPPPTPSAAGDHRPGAPL